MSRCGGSVEGQKSLYSLIGIPKKSQIALAVQKPAMASLRFPEGEIRRYTVGKNAI